VILSIGAQLVPRPPMVVVARPAGPRTHSLNNKHRIRLPEALMRV